MPAWLCNTDTGNCECKENVSSTPVSPMECDYDAHPTCDAQCTSTQPAHSCVKCEQYDTKPPDGCCNNDYMTDQSQCYKACPYAEVVDCEYNPVVVMIDGEQKNKVVKGLDACQAFGLTVNGQYLSYGFVECHNNVCVCTPDSYSCGK